MSSPQSIRLHRFRSFISPLYLSLLFMLRTLQRKAIKSCINPPAVNHRQMKKDAWKIEVTDRQSFQEFVGLLISDFEKNKDRWENNNLELFLSAIQSYAGELDGFYRNNHPEMDAEIPTWRAFADILRGAVVYE